MEEKVYGDLFAHKKKDVFAGAFTVYIDRLIFSVDGKPLAFYWPTEIPWFVANV